MKKKKIFFNAPRTVICLVNVLCVHSHRRPFFFTKFARPKLVGNRYAIAFGQEISSMHYASDTRPAARRWFLYGPNRTHRIDKKI